MRTALHTAKGYAPSADMQAAAHCAYFGNPPRTLAEAAFLRDASEEDALLASRSASWRRQPIMQALIGHAGIGGELRKQVIEGGRSAAFGRKPKKSCTSLNHGFSSHEER